MTAQEAAEARRSLMALFAGAGHVAVEPSHLQPASVLLDLYGEDLRGRSFIFPDNERIGELCLRPDFTVPVALLHRDGPGWGAPARYAYAGPVFRRQERPMQRPLEYLQTGIERFGDTDRPAADAAVFRLITDGLDRLGAGQWRAVIGDLGIAFAAIDAVEMSDRRRRALRRHFWRPKRFQELLASYMAPPPKRSPRRQALLDALDAPDPAAALRELAGGASMVGLREPQEILARARDLRAETKEPPLAASAADLIEAVLAVQGSPENAVTRLRDLSAQAGAALDARIDTLEQRLDAIGLNDRLEFDAAFGRNLEYYDGFVFEITSAENPNLPPLAGGGRYDAMTLRLGAAEPVSAVGAMIRPEAALAASEGRA